MVSFPSDFFPSLYQACDELGNFGVDSPALASAVDRAKTSTFTTLKGATLALEYLKEKLGEITKRSGVEISDTVIPKIFSKCVHDIAPEHSYDENTAPAPRPPTPVKDHPIDLWGFPSDDFALPPSMFTVQKGVDYRKEEHRPDFMEPFSLETSTPPRPRTLTRSPSYKFSGPMGGVLAPIGDHVVMDLSGMDGDEDVRSEPLRIPLGENEERDIRDTITLFANMSTPRGGQGRSQIQEKMDAIIAVHAKACVEDLKKLLDRVVKDRELVGEGSQTLSYQQPQPASSETLSDTHFFGDPAALDDLMTRMSLEDDLPEDIEHERVMATRVVRAKERSESAQPPV